MSGQQVFETLAVIVLASPLVLLLFTSFVAVMPFRDREKAIRSATFLAILTGLLASLGIAAGMAMGGESARLLDLGDWVAIEEESFHFHVAFVFDRLSVPFLIMVWILCGTVAAFTSRYLHREPGFQRYFILYSLFTAGMVISSLARTIEVLFLGWELVGLSSALLVGFFHERQSPVMNGLRVWGVYRVADAAFLVGALVLHHMTNHGDFTAMTGRAAWPATESNLEPSQAFVAGLLLLVAAAGKSALIPFSGWLPRAMEGPTASSAIFYGALSVHLGAYLLLRACPLIAASPALSAMVVCVGLATALYASVVSSVQADVKSALAFASLTQVGLIVAEIGMGWYVLALLHILGHAFLRTLQLLRAPNLLHDYFKMETAMGRRIVAGDQPRLLSRYPFFRNQVYHFALNRGYLDSFLDGWVIGPFCTVFRLFTRWESRWIAMWEKPVAPVAGDDFASGQIDSCWSEKSAVDHERVSG